MEEFEKKEIVYSKYFIAFLDVLGFKEMVFGKGKEQIEEYFGLVQHVTQRLENIKEKKNLKSIIISDSVILSIPLGDEIGETISNLRNLCVAIGKIQYILAKKNIWLRGAISSGDSYFNYKENLVVGPAFVNAYLLEETISKYPRVILDNKIVKDIQANNSQDAIDTLNNEKFTNWNTDILFNWEEKNQGKTPLVQDVALFIDYLSPMFNDFDESIVLLKNISEKIYSKNAIYPKFRWVVDYLLSHAEDLNGRERVMVKGDFREIYLSLKKL